VSVTAPVDELHPTAHEMSWVLPSLKVPVACITSGTLTARVEGFGVNTIAVSTADVTVSWAEPGIPVAGSVAVIVADPSAVAVAMPMLPAALDTEAELLDDDQVTEVVNGCELPSL